MIQIGRWRVERFTIVAYVLLIMGTVVVLYPYFHIIQNSVKPGAEILNSPNKLPSHITWAGYRGVFKDLPVSRMFRNSLILAVSITLLNTTLCLIAAYAFAKIPFPGNKPLFGFMLLTMMIPGVLFLIPTYVIMFRLHWVGTFWALIIPSAVGVYNIFLIRQFLIGIPTELIEAARIDGASELLILRRIIFPLARPVLATVAILNFMSSWNDFFNSLLYLNKPNLWTVQLGVYQFQSTIPGNHTEQIWAATALVSFPLIVVYFFMQEQFTKAFANVSFK